MKTLFGMLILTFNTFASSPQTGPELKIFGGVRYKCQGRNKNQCLPKTPSYLRFEQFTQTNDRLAFSAKKVTANNKTVSFVNPMINGKPISPYTQAPCTSRDRLGLCNSPVGLKDVRGLLCNHLGLRGLSGNGGSKIKYYSNSKPLYVVYDNSRQFWDQRKAGGMLTRGFNYDAIHTLNCSR